MRLVKYGATFLACSIAFAAGSSAALARPYHHHHSRHHHVHVAHHHAAHHHHLRAEYGSSIAHSMMAAVPSGTYSGPGSMPEYAASGSESFAAVAPVRRARLHGHFGKREHVASEPVGTLGGFSSSLVADARRYLGTNPTSRRTLWCGAFMDKILRDTGHRGGGNLATGYLHYGHRISGPRVGAIAVMYRHGGGHVGVVSGVDPNGNPIIVSGNHNNTVAESVYPRGRIAAYVEPGG